MAEQLQEQLRRFATSEDTFYEQVFFSFIQNNAKHREMYVHDVECAHDAARKAVELRFGKSDDAPGD